MGSRMGRKDCQSVLSIMEAEMCCKMEEAVAIQPPFLPLHQRPSVLVDVYPVD
jgi:hypothetical protein